MIAFVSLFLGLIAGPQPVELTVSGEVAAVELRLDGVSLGVLRGEPWTLVCDLGPGLAPHRLEAVGFDGAGREVARVEQWLNLPRPQREVELVLEQEPGRPPHGARLVWETVEGWDPDAATVTFDGEVLDLAAPRVFALPPYDPAVPHLLQAELQFGRHYLRADKVVGGGPANEELGAALTAFPVFLAPGARRPEPREMEGWLTSRGRALRVVAVERAPAELLMVQDTTPRLQDRLALLGRQLAVINRRTRPKAPFPTGLKYRDRFRLVFPFLHPDVAVRPAHAMEIFPLSVDLTHLSEAPTGTIRRATGVLAAIPFLPDVEAPPEEQRLADAVAVAGLVAASSQRGRAVVLLATAESPDRSRFDPVAVREYLRQLQVPLVVWAPLGDDAIPGWGRAQDVSTPARLLRAVRELRQLLDPQLVVWLEGRHQPQEIEMSPAALARFLPTTGDPVIAASAGEDFEESEPEPAASAEPSADLTETFAETVDVHVVNVEAVVTDRSGRRVRDLSRDDFEVFEDGQPMEITNFLPPEPETEPSTEPGAAPAAESAPMAEVAAAGAGDGNPLHLLVYLDPRHLAMAQRLSVLKALRDTFADLPAGTRVMLLSSTDTSLTRATFTDDPARLTATLAALERSLGAPSATARESGRLVDEMVEVSSELTEAAGNSQNLELAQDRSNALLNQLRASSQSAEAEVRATIGALGRLAASLGGIDGRKALLYVGDHLTLTPSAELFAAAERTLASDDLTSFQLGAESKALDLFHDFQEAVRQANANGVTFYSLAPLTTLHPGGVEVAAAGPPGLQSALRSVRDASIEEGTCFITQSTGGVCQVRGTEPRLLLEEAIDDGAASYSLGYAPAREPDGKLHRIEVKVKRPGLSVRHREGYFDKPREDRLQDLLSAALLFGTETDALEMQLTFEAQQPLPKQGTFLVPLDVRLPVARLAMLPTADGKQRSAKARLLVSTMDAQGRVAAAQEFPIAFAVAEEQLRSGKEVVYSHKVHLTLAAGVQKVAIGVWDETGRAGSFLRRTVTVGE